MSVESPPVDSSPGPVVVTRIDARAEAGAIHLRLLDGFRLERCERPIATPQASCRLLAFLGIRGRSSRSEVAGHLWPEAPESKANASLRTVLWRLRQTSDEQLVIGGQVLALAPGVAVDVATFLAIAHQVLVPAPASDPGGLSAASLVGAGELLPGWYDDWVLFERERLRQLRMHALEALARRWTAAGRHAEAIEAALAAVRLEPLRESATRVLIMAHLAEHNVVEAVRCYVRFRDDLHRELGVAPTPDLERMVLRGPHSLIPGGGIGPPWQVGRVGVQFEEPPARGLQALGHHGSEAHHQFASQDGVVVDEGLHRDGVEL
jgi:DNA-binding SARP family transcriptional activator